MGNSGARPRPFLPNLCLERLQLGLPLHGVNFAMVTRYPNFDAHSWGNIAVGNTAHAQEAGKDPRHVWALKWSFMGLFQKKTINAAKVYLIAQHSPFEAGKRIIAAPCPIPPTLFRPQSDACETQQARLLQQTATTSEPPPQGASSIHQTTCLTANSNRSQQPESTIQSKAK